MIPPLSSFSESQGSSDILANDLLFVFLSISQFSCSKGVCAVHDNLQIFCCAGVPG
jgi:hypothetical protein